MLPETHHDHDSKWIAEQLELIPLSVRSITCANYSDVYNETLTTCKDELTREGMARREANTRLRIFVARTSGNKLAEVNQLKGE